MKELVNMLKEYFENTHQNIIEKDWDELKELNDIGPDVSVYVDEILLYYNGGQSNIDVNPDYDNLYREENYFFLAA